MNTSLLTTVEGAHFTAYTLANDLFFLSKCVLGRGDEQAKTGQ
jgi:hypothetical protein